VSVGAAAAFLPAAGLVLAGGLLAGGVAVPALAGCWSNRLASAVIRISHREPTTAACGLYLLVGLPETFDRKLGSRDE